MAVLVMVTIIAGCRPSEPSEPLKMWSIELGNGVDKDERITDATRTFNPTSTVYASIETKGAGQGKLLVEWAAGSKIVATQTREISPSEPAHFAFHFAPPDGWPKGTNRVRFSMSDDEKHIAEFQVE